MKSPPHTGYRLLQESDLGSQIALGRLGKLREDGRARLTLTWQRDEDHNEASCAIVSRDFQW